MSQKTKKRRFKICCGWTQLGGWARERAKQVIFAKTKDRSSVPIIHLVEREKWLLRLSLLTPPPRPPHTNIKITEGTLVFPVGLEYYYQTCLNSVSSPCFVLVGWFKGEYGCHQKSQPSENLPDGKQINLCADEAHEQLRAPVCEASMLIMW